MIRVHRVLYLLVAGLAPILSVAHDAVRVTEADARNPVEVAVAINPRNPEHVVAVSMQTPRATGPRTSNFVYNSNDGGKTWRTIAGANIGRTQGDDAMAFGPDGTVHRTWIAFDGLRTPRPVRASTGIYAASSTDGVTWSTPVAVVDHVNSVAPFEDKPWLCVDGVEGSPHRNHIYVAWTRFDLYGSRNAEHKSHIYFTRSTNGGKSFLPCQRISQTPGDCLDGDGTVEGAVPAVGTRGEVFVAWAGPKGLVFVKSLDGGQKFSDEKHITDTPGGWDSPVAGMPRHNGLPVTCCDTSPGPHRGSLYVNWIDERNGDLDVWVIASRDGGDTWEKPVRVNDDATNNGRAQMFTWLAVDQADGSLNVVFYDRRDAADQRQGLTLARSVDGGKTFVNRKVNIEPFTIEGPRFFGDYIGIDARAGRVVAVFPHVVDKQIVLSAAALRFKPGTQDLMDK